MNLEKNQLENHQHHQENDFSEHSKNLVVQEILNESLNNHEDIETNQSSILSRRSSKSSLTSNSIQISPNNNSNISVLTENLILTSAICIIPQILNALDVTCIICAAPELPFLPPIDDVNYHKINIYDTPNMDISMYFDEVADIIDQEAAIGGRTIIFCVAGISRSATLCIAYLMKYHHLTLLEAYNYVKERRTRIHPNCGFFQQLIDYEKELFNSTTINIVYNEFLQCSIPEVYDNDYKQIRIFNRKRNSNNNR